MSRYADEFVVGVPLQEAVELCREAVSGLGWEVLEQTGPRIVCHESLPEVRLWSAKVEIELSAHGQDTTLIHIEGSFFGFGPVPSRHVKGQVGRLRNEIEVVAKRRVSPASGGASGLSAELEKLSDLRQRGALTEEEYLKAKAKLLG